MRVRAWFPSMGEAIAYAQLTLGLKNAVIEAAPAQASIEALEARVAALTEENHRIANEAVDTGDERETLKEQVESLTRELAAAREKADNLRADLAHHARRLCALAGVAEPAVEHAEAAE
jgi:septal ring factor EnvC (AmiA/AmiB activator)